MNRQHRSMEIRSVEAGGREFTAIAVRYDVVDTYETTFAPGSMAASLREKLPKLTWGHRWESIIGRVVEVIDDNATELIVRCRLSDPEAVPLARQAMAQLRDGDVTDVSIGFSPISSERRDGIVVFTECVLDEIALVLAGAVPGAKVLALRSIEDVHARQAKMISEEDAARIISATIEKMQGGAVGTDVLLAGLQDLKSLTVERDEHTAEEAKSEDEGKPGTETSESEESAVTGTEATSTEPAVEKEDQTTTAEATATESTTETAEAETEDAEIEALLAEVDALMEQDDVWVPEVETPAVVGETANG